MRNDARLFAWVVGTSLILAAPLIQKAFSAARAASADEVDDEYAGLRGFEIRVLKRLEAIEGKVDAIYKVQVGREPERTTSLAGDAIRRLGRTLDKLDFRYHADPAIPPEALAPAKAEAARIKALLDAGQGRDDDRVALEKILRRIRRCEDEAEDAAEANFVMPN